jgi:flagellar hook protein FlgE
MIGSLYSGISGLKANASTMSVIGDNIANVNTTGFKSSSVSFANIFAATLGSGENEIGRGVVLKDVVQNWESGALENTNSTTDLSINGQGMFLVSDPRDGNQYFTRAGNFQFDRNDQLVTNDGMQVQGYQIDPVTGAVLGIGNITLPAGTNNPNETTQLGMALNLDGSAADTTTYDTTITVYDSLGNPVELTFNFVRDLSGATPAWDWSVTPSRGASATTGTLTFNVDGSLATPAADPTINITGLTGATNPLDINWVLTDGSVTGYAGNSSKTAQNQDGYSSGSLQGIEVDEYGIFTGLYSNGVQTPFAQIALADFASYTGLSKMGSNLYAASTASGQPLIGTAGTAGMGSVTSGALEMSNVDLASEFVDMITTQRAFQANSRVITSSDDMLAELINIKR